MTQPDLFQIDGNAVTPPNTEARKRRPSPKQSAVLAALRNGGTLSLDDAVKLIGQNLYTNERFHVGNLLSNMVKRGLLKRQKPGVFCLPG